MELITNTHKIIIVTFVLLVLIATGVLIYLRDIDDKAVLSEVQTTLITAEVPHEITIIVKPESRIPPTGNDSIPLTVEIRPEASLTALKTFNITATNTGDAYLGVISTSEIPIGTYDIAIKGISHLRRVFPSEVFDGPIQRTYTLTTPNLSAGDTNPTADNYVNSLDISYMSLNLYTNETRSDLTHDGIVNSLDYSALLKNLYSNGDN